MKVLIDADSLVYSVPYGCETPEEAKEKFDSVIKFIVNQIKESYDVEEVIMYHGTNGVNFRKEISDEYKAQRKNNKHDFYYDVSNYVSFVYDAKKADGEEIDDIVARDWKTFTDNGIDACIVSIDKDYKQLPECLIYNYGKDKATGDPKGFMYITKDDAEVNFWTQMIVGDSADNVNYIKGKGEKYCEKIFEGRTERFSLFRSVYTEFIKEYGTDAKNKFTECYKLLKIGL